MTAVEVGGIAPDEGALHIDHGDGAVAIADGVIRGPGGGPLGFVPDGLMGDDPETVKAGLRDSFRGLLERDFDTLLLAHGEPVVGRGAQGAARVRRIATLKATGAGPRLDLQGSSHTTGTTGFDVDDSVGSVASRGARGLVKHWQTNKCGL